MAQIELVHEHGGILDGRVEGVLVGIGDWAGFKGGNERRLGGGVVVG